MPMNKVRMKINKHLEASVDAESVELRDDQHGEVTLSARNFEELFREYLAQRERAREMGEI